MCGIKIEEKRITNDNAGILDTYISAESSKTEKSRIFLDFGNVEYISSAGIRIHCRSSKGCLSGDEGRTLPYREMVGVLENEEHFQIF